MQLVVIACHKKNNDSSIYSCVQSIRSSNPSIEILIVDSDSEDKSYYQDILKYGNIQVLDARNHNFDTGAYWIAFDYRKDVDYFYFIQDTILVNTCLDSFRLNEFNSLRYFISMPIVGGVFFMKTRLQALKFVLEKFKFLRSEKPKFDGYGFDTKEQLIWSEKALSDISIPIPPVFTSIFGPIMFISRDLMLKLRELGLNSILPKNKMQQMAMERIWGICLSKVGADLSSSAQGSHFKVPLEYAGFRKNFLRRE